MGRLLLPPYGIPAKASGPSALSLADLLDTHENREERQNQLCHRDALSGASLLMSMVQGPIPLGKTLRRGPSLD